MAGRKDLAVGTVKKTIGKATGKKRLETEGTVQKTAGKVQEKVGKASAKVRGAVGGSKEQSPSRGHR